MLVIDKNEKVKIEYWRDTDRSPKRTAKSHYYKFIMESG